MFAGPHSGKTKISDEMGYFARFIDTEGNLIGIFSMK
jgi:predicted enzyme related to lactoylglutathione lyase